MASPPATSLARATKLFLLGLTFLGVGGFLLGVSFLLVGMGSLDNTVPGIGGLVLMLLGIGLAAQNLE